jgi:fructose-specific phosphotransferase system IIC component
MAARAARQRRVGRLVLTGAITGIVAAQLTGSRFVIGIAGGAIAGMVIGWLLERLRVTSN